MIKTDTNLVTSLNILTSQSGALEHTSSHLHPFTRIFVLDSGASDKLHRVDPGTGSPLDVIVVVHPGKTQVTCWWN